MRIRALSFLLIGMMAVLMPVPPASAQPDLPADLDLTQFYPDHADFGEGWTTKVESNGPPSLGELAQPPNCSDAQPFAQAVGAPRMVADGADEASLTVGVVRPAGGAAAAVQAAKDWAARCPSFTVPGGGGTRGRNYVSVKPADPPPAPVSDSAASVVTAQGPFLPAEIHVVAAVRGVLVLVSHRFPPRAHPNQELAAEVYRATVAKINAWQG